MNTLRCKSLEDFSIHVTRIVEDKSHTVSAPIAIGVPGGRGAKSIVDGVLRLDDSLLARLTFYLVDERLSGETNRQTLYDYGFQKAINQKRMRRDQLIIPNEGHPFLLGHHHLDLLFLGIGEDGHFASLFPGSFTSNVEEDVIKVTNSPKMPKERVSLSYRALKRYTEKQDVYLLFFGEGKRDAYHRFLSGQESVETLPVLFCTTLKSNVTVATDLL
jgi:6-phosphogluconolactonase